MSTDFIAARRLANEPTDVRLDAANLWLAFFLESFATRSLTRLVSGGRYADIRPLRPIDEIDTVFQQHFGALGKLVLLRPRPSPESPDYPEWLRANCPATMTVEDFVAFVNLCDMAIGRFELRRVHEENVALGIKISAFTLGKLIQALLVIASFWHGSLIVGLGIAMLVTAFCIGRLNI